MLERHWKLLRESAELHRGREFGAEGDAMFFVFDDPVDAVAAALDGQLSLAGGPLQVRMGVHTGEAWPALGTWLGVAVHQTARTCAAGHGGQVLVSDATARLVADRLPAGASLRPLGDYRLRDITGSQRIHQLDHPARPEAFPPLRTPSAAVTNLPNQLTAFIGRAGELAEVRRLVDGNRLVTLAGPGGTGKTRLALEVAGHAGPGFAAGVWLTELAPVEDPEQVEPALALSVGADGDLAAGIGDRHLLLVVDNCEHVINTVARVVARVVEQCENAHVLATSREQLGIPGEVVWRVPPLQPVEAVRLFADRALSARPGFEITAANERAVTEICNRLDGLPLAVELAAARTSLLSPEQVLERLDDRFRLLTGGGRASLPRQQTLAALVDWSHDLLDDEERRLFRRLAVFAGSFDVDAATAVGGESALAALDSLVRKSLVVAEFPDRSDGPPRFRMLETIRAYAATRLEQSGELPATRRAHRAAYLDLLRQARFLGPEQVAWLDRVEADIDNCLAAVASAVDDDVEEALELAGLLGPFWGIRSRLREGRRVLEEVLARAGPGADSRRLLRCHSAAGIIARLQGDMDAALVHHQAQLELARSDNEDELARALSSLGNVHLAVDDIAAARPLFVESVTIRRRLGDRRGIALSLNNLGVLADAEGDHEAARGYYEELLEIVRDLGDTRVEGQTLTNLGLVALANGCLDEAEELLHRSATLLRSVGDARGVAITLATHAGVLRRRARESEALALYDEALRVLHEVGDLVGVAMCLQGVAAVLAGRDRDGDARRAAWLLGAASLLPVGRAERGAAEAESAAVAEREARRTIGEAFDVEYEKGRAATLPEAVTTALAV